MSYPALTLSIIGINLKFILLDPRFYPSDDIFANHNVIDTNLTVLRVLKLSTNFGRRRRPIFFGNVMVKNTKISVEFFETARRAENFWNPKSNKIK